MNATKLKRCQDRKNGYLWKSYFKMSVRERIYFRIEMKGIFGFTYPQTNNEEGC